MNFRDYTIRQLKSGLVNKDFSITDLVATSLQRIKEVENKVKAFITVTEDLAQAKAKEFDQVIFNKKWDSDVFGMPAGIKDVLATKGIKTTAGAKILENYTAVYDATAVSHLKERGMVMMGKNNCDEFAMGSSTENSAFFTTHNPWDLKKVPGGSSGGGAAAVAAGEVVYALGTDTGGSVRQPASFCGVVGLKPTYGRVSRYGLIAMASSLDLIGIFANHVDDAAVVLENIAGYDKRDATTIRREKFKSADIDGDIKGLTIGLPKEYFVSGLDSKIEKLVKERIEELEKAGAKIKQVSLPHAEYALACYYIIMPAEVSSNLAKFDGLRFGTRTEKKVDDLLDYYMKTRGEGLGTESRRRILLGTYVLSSGYIDAYYLQAQRVRAKIIEDYEKAFTQVDVLISPTTPTTAFAIGEKVDDPISMYLSDIYTVAVNLAGLPAVSVPAGLADNMPAGIQIIGKRFDEATVLKVGKKIEELRGKLPIPKL